MEVKSKITLDEFTLDSLRRVFGKEDEVINLYPQTFDWLPVLLKRQGEIVCTEKLPDMIRGEQLLEEESSTVIISFL